MKEGKDVSDVTDGLSDEDFKTFINLARLVKDNPIKLDAF